MMILALIGSILGLIAVIKGSEYILRPEFQGMLGYTLGFFGVQIAIIVLVVIMRG